MDLHRDRLNIFLLHSINCRSVGRRIGDILALKISADLIERQ